MTREQSWRDEPPPEGRIVLLSANPVSEAIAAIAAIVGREAVLLDDDEDGAGVAALDELGLTAADAVVVCDHDAPDAAPVLRAALGSPAGYVAMLASRSRTEGLLPQLAAEGYADALPRLHMPAGLATGGRRPGEMALSVIAEIVATSYGTSGGPLRTHV